jgi:drug/metabolite transporter (DMT)-like permease
MMAVSPVIWLLPLIWMIWHGTHFGPLYIPLLGGFFQAIYCVLMGKGYACGDLSQVYPLARGLAPALIAIIAWPLFGEHLSPTGIIGLLAVIAGSLLLNTGHYRELFNGGSLRALCQPAPRMALMAAVMIALYHLTDKAGAVRADSAFAYLCAMHVSLVSFLTVFTLTQRTPAQIGEEWRRNWRSAFVVTVFCFVAYFLVVSAMKLSAVAYVASLRNVSILVGVLLGVTALREQGVFWRVTGALCMVAGILAIALRG